MDDQSIDTVARAALALLSRFVDPAFAGQIGDLARALQPQPDDYAKVFTAEVAEQVKAAYKVFWETLPPWPVRKEQTQLHVHAARVEDFLEETPRGRQFPGGYKSIAKYLVPGPIWVCWKHTEPGRESGLAFDGLVSLEGRFAWFPKPWKMLRATILLAELSHWSE